MGVQADPELLKAEANARVVRGVSIKVDGHGLYSSVSSITDSGVPAYLKFLVNGADAETAYAGFLEFKVVVKKYQVASTDIKLWLFKVHEP